MSYATCENSECGNYNIPIDVGSLSWVDEVTGETRTVDEVVCGACGQVITLITDTPPDVTPPPDEF